MTTIDKLHQSVDETSASMPWSHPGAAQSPNGNRRDSTWAGPPQPVSPKNYQTMKGRLLETKTGRREENLNAMKKHVFEDENKRD